MRPEAWNTLRKVGRASSGNRLELYSQGDAAYFAMWRAIRAARRRVWLETYILAADGVGRGTLRLLARAARRGCEVCLCYDAVGSYGFDAEELKELLAAGGRAMVFNPPFEPGGPPPQVRDHRKLLICDRRAFLGGMNVADEYAGPRLGSGFFRDVQVSVEGPAVADLAGFFREVAGKLRPSYFPDLDHGEPAGEHEVLVLASDQRREVWAVQRALRIALHRAESRAHLTSPYFLPTPRLARALIGAARRGVAVELITAGKTDSRLARAAGRYVYDRFLREGVRVLERTRGALHAKTMLVDDALAFVGSQNLDRWSDGRNLELAIAVRAPHMVEMLRQAQEESRRHSRPITLEDLGRAGWLTRLGRWVAFQLLRV